MNGRCRADPPYWDCETDYGKILFERADFERLAEQLSDLKGRFLMSINDVPQIRETFAEFHMREVATTFCLKKQGGAWRAC